LSAVRTVAFDDLPATPATHARLYFYAAVIGLVRQALESFGSFEALAKQFPFVSGYVNELATFGLEGVDIARAPARWRDALQAWERRASARLPLRALARQTGLGYAELVALAGATLADEEMRFGALFSAMHGIDGQARPNAGMIARWAACESPDSDLSPVRRLIDLGMLEATNPEAPAAAWCVRLPAVYSNVLHGAAPGTLGPGIRYHAAAHAPGLDSLLLPDPLRDTVQRLGELIAGGEVDTVVVRGPQDNGRRTLVRALAAARGQGVLEVGSAQAAPPAALKALGPLATLLDAVPLLVFECAPGESAALPEMNGEVPWRAAVLGRAGGIRGLGGRKPAVLTLSLPDADTRRRLWARATPDLPERDASLFAARFRMTSGAILQMATAANAQARLSGAGVFAARHLAQARETLDRGELETLATRIAPASGWDQLVAAADTRAELAVLEQRCRHRERLSAGGAGASCGVRALLKGPSGCGKTLAARVLACALDHMDLYRVDLAAVVDKYVGESEKRLGRLFDRAQELDAILLFDEGDALFGRRTASLHSSTDRYANLQTNFLLQRLESHDGIVLVTTNLADAIDSAFQRRMDVVVEFGQPDAEQRLAIWRLHLPEDHQVRGELLEEVAYRCSLSGGQIRNAASHAELVALSQETALRDAHLLAAVQREYRKSGALCPLRAHERAA
jgi:hypothetical protein